MSLSSGGRSRRRKGQKGAPRRATGGRRHQENILVASKGWMVRAALEAELEDEAAGRQHALNPSMPVYSDLTALPPALFLFRSLPTPAAHGDDPKKFREPATRMMGSPVPHGAAPDT